MKTLAIVLLAFAFTHALAQTDSVQVHVNSSVRVNRHSYIINPARIILRTGKVIDGYAIYTYQNKYGKAVAKKNAHTFIWPYLHGYTDRQGNKISRKLIDVALEPNEW